MTELFIPLLIARGHAAIRGTHTKTIEFIEDSQLGSGGTCILGVAAAFDREALARFRGPVTLRLEVEGEPDSAESLTALVNPNWRRTDPFILRQHPEPQDRCWAYAASRSAADLDRALIRRLANPEARIILSAAPLVAAAAPEPQGLLTLVGLPIGEPADLAPRAVAALLDADWILAEDTRVAVPLLARIGAKAPMRAAHDHNESALKPWLMRVLAGGARVAVISDAGMPAIADPGHALVQAAIEAGARVTAVPGPAALILALAISGLPSDRFSFLGFPPRQAKARHLWLVEALARRETVLLYETPHRLAETLAEAAALAPDRPAVLVKELTKIHERVLRATLATLSAEAAAAPPRGEHVLVIAPAPQAPDQGAESGIGALESGDARALAERLLADGVPVKVLARALADLTGRPRRDWFQALQASKDARSGADPRDSNESDPDE